MDASIFTYCIVKLIFACLGWNLDRHYRLHQPLYYSINHPGISHFYLDCVFFWGVEILWKIA